MYESTFNMNPHRLRIFAFTISLALSLIAPTPFATASQIGPEKSPPPRYNVLIIVSDDLNDSVEGMGGHPQAMTPHIDRIQQSGVRFTRAMTNDPLCAPARASMWSGLYPHTSGNYSFEHWRNNEVLKDTVTVMEHFRRHGYLVWGTGKVFHNHHEDLTVYDDYQHDADFGPWPWTGKGTPTWQSHPAFEWWEDYDTSGMRNMGDLHYAPLSQIPSWKPDPARDIPGHTGWMLWGKPFRWESDENRDAMPDELVAEFAVQKLKQQHEQPFMLVVGFNRPHTPLYAPDEYFDKFPLEAVQLPPHLERDLNDVPAETMRKFQPYGFNRFDLLQKLPKDRNFWKEWVRAYLANVAFMDDQVGKVLDALEQSKYAENTIILFTSDHGYHMGEKNYIFKDTLWEESLRVPFVVAVPGLTPQGVECRHPVSLIDIYPTLIDLCGLDSDPNAGGNDYALDGHSIKPFLEDPENGRWQGPPVALSMIGGYATPGDDPIEHEQRHFSVRDERYRYSLYETGEEELYDLVDDPNQWTNLAGETILQPVKERLRVQLQQILSR
jgi:arylsulfatase A-like enzyme